MIRILLRNSLKASAFLAFMLLLILVFGCANESEDNESEDNESEDIAVMEVFFPDSNLEAAIREEIGKPTGAITTVDLEDMTVLDGNVWYGPIQNLDGLQYCSYLKKLSLVLYGISDISPLAGLTNLTYLGLGENQISDISPLAGLTNLTYLDLGYNQISDISPLVENTGWGGDWLIAPDTINLRMNPLNTTSCEVLIPELESRGGYCIRQLEL